MDKYEYKLKLDEIETLAGQKNYAAAAQIADGINWRKVRNVNSLMLVGEIYQQNGRYEHMTDLRLERRLFIDWLRLQLRPSSLTRHRSIMMNLLRLRLTIHSNTSCAII